MGLNQKPTNSKTTPARNTQQKIVTTETITRIPKQVIKQTPGKQTPPQTLHAVRRAPRPVASKKPTAPAATTSQAKPTIIMIHGFRGTHHGLLLIAKYLKGSANIIVPDLPGFGRGDHLEAYTLDAYVEWLHIFISQQKLTQPPFLMGHSFGSIVCAAYVAKYPKTVKRLVLVNPIGAPALEGPNKLMTKLAVFYYKVGAKLPEKPAKAWLSSKPIVRVMSVTMAKTHDKGLRTYIHHQHDRYFSRFHSAQSVLESFTTSISHNVGDFANNIPVPTLLIAGSLDDITPLSEQYSLAKKFPKARLRVIDDVGHLTHYETPERVAALIQAFIKSV